MKFCKVLAKTQKSMFACRTSVIFTKFWIQEFPKFTKVLSVFMDFRVLPEPSKIQVNTTAAKFQKKRGKFKLKEASSGNPKSQQKI
jgi:hypothetical protein